MTRHTTSLLTVVIILVAACGDSGSHEGLEDRDAAPSAPVVTTTVVATATSTAAPTTMSTHPPTTTTSAESTWPAELAYHEMLYDAGADLVLVLGGLGPGIVPMRELWALDPHSMTWAKLGELPTDLDPVGVPAAYDAESNRVIYLQTTGFDHASDPVSTWAYDTEAAIWTEMTPDPHPRLGFGARMAYDSESDRMIVYGGMGFGEGGLFVTPGTWAYDYNSNTWEEMIGAPQPPGVNYHAIAYDSGSDRVIVCGLNDADPENVISVMWSFDYNSNTWEELPTASGPESGSAYSRAVYDPESDRVLMLGGLQMLDGEFAAHGELWGYDDDAGSWEEATSFGAPLVHHDMVLVGSTGELVVFGGGPSDLETEFQGNALWTYDPDSETWTRVGP